MKKKGYVQDILFFGIILLVVAFIVLAGGKLRTDFNEKYQDMDLVSDDAKEIVQKNTDRYTNVFNWIYLAIFVLFAITIFVTVFMLDTHPAFYFIILIIFAFVIIVIGILGNTYDKFSTNENLATETTQLNVLDALMDNWVIIMLVIGFIAITLLLSRNR